MRMIYNHTCLKHNSSHSFILKKGYYQVPMEESSKQCTVFATSEGLYHFRVLPFGFSKSHSTFMRLMRKMFGHHTNILHFYYIFVYSSSFDNIYLILSVSWKVQDNMDSPPNHQNMRLLLTHSFSYDTKLEVVIWNQTKVTYQKSSTLKHLLQNGRSGKFWVW